MFAFVCARVTKINHIKNKVFTLLKIHFLFLYFAHAVTRIHFVFVCVGVFVMLSLSCRKADCKREQKKREWTHALCKLSVALESLDLAVDHSELGTVFNIQYSIIE